MIVAVGCDIVEHEKTSLLEWLDNPHILKRIFSESEIELCSENNPERYYSSRFAVKEAILKCLKTGMEDGISLNQIEINKNDKGAVSVSLIGEVKKLAEMENITKWHISISHSTHSSIAFVIAENLNTDYI